MEAVYLKIFNHQFYKIENGKCISINTERNSMKNTVSLPSGYMKNVTVSSEKEFEKAKQSIGF